MNAASVFDNARIAAVFEEIADLLEVQDENPFRIRAYRNAARMVRQQGPDFAARAARGEALAKMFGIGADLDAKIHEIARTGSCELLQQLRRSVPRGTATLLHVPGLGPKKVHALGQGLGVHSPTDLVNALKSGRLSELRGFGPKTEDRLREALGAHRGKKQRVPLAVAEREAGPLVAYMRSNPAVRETVVAGSLRRKRDSVGDIDLLVVSDRGPAVARHFVAYPAFREVLAQGAKRASAVLASGLQVDLRVVPAESYGAALMYFTGSKAYNIELRRRAIARGLKLNEYGLFKGERRIAGATEESIYAALDLPWLAPEKREIDIA
ncbi:MAG TPA: nucleotidyltransferase domain-containing protein [Burkholderiaceae bacterium]|nr:nucleotidyltransferase domain-containing protein [Burkholderiaceae bacterium]